MTRQGGHTIPVKPVLFFVMCVKVMSGWEGKNSKVLISNSGYF